MPHTMKFEFEGPNAEIMANDLGNLLAVEFADWPQRFETLHRSPRDGDLGVRGDPVAVAALVLSVPSAILATWDLATRIRVRERVERLIRWYQQQRRSNRQTKITVIGLDGRSSALDQLPIAEIVDGLERLARESG